MAAENQAIVKRVLPVPSYLNIFGIDCNQINLIFNNKGSNNSEDYNNENNDSVSSIKDEAELTGNPLIVDLDQEDLPLVSIANHVVPTWSFFDKSRYPLKLKEARIALNREKKLVSNELPIFVLCDGKDKSNIIILGINDKDMMSVDIMAQGIMSYPEVNSSLQNMVNSHVKSVNPTNSNRNVPINYNVKVNYNLFGMSIKQMLATRVPLNYNCPEQCCFIALEVVTDKCVFDITNFSKFKLTLHIELVPHSNLKYYELWNEFNLLKECLTVLSNSDSDVCENMKICLLEIDPLNESDIFNEIRKLLEKPLQTTNRREFKQNRQKEFFKNLWNIMKRCRTIANLVNSWYYFFEYYSVLSSNLDTTLNKELFNISYLMTAISKNKLVLSTITSKQALELFFEIGTYKLKYDFENIYSTFVSTAMHNINTIWSSIHGELENLRVSSDQVIKLTGKIREIPMATRTKKLAYIERLYKGIELINETKNKITLSPNSFSKFCEYVQREYILNIPTSLDILPFFQLSITLNSNDNDVSLIENILPNSWTMSMTSSVCSTCVTTAYNLSDSPIIPENIYNYGSPIKTKEKSYFVSKMIRISHITPKH